MQLTEIVKSVGEVFTSMQICSDASGVRGLTFHTSLTQSYSCGQTSGSCSSLSGDGAALTGFGAVCGSAGSLLRVQRVTSPCWTRNYAQPTSPSSECQQYASQRLPQQMGHLHSATTCRAMLAACLVRRHCCSTSLCPMQLCIIVFSWPLVLGPLVWQTRPQMHHRPRLCPWVRPVLLVVELCYILTARIYLLPQAAPPGGGHPCRACAAGQWGPGGPSPCMA
jgi:hypothetical protein